MTQPNILILMDDQHRFDYVGYAGADFIRTPNIDSIAQRGLAFNHCYCNSPVCAPSRVGLASGIRPDKLGGLDNRVFLPRDIRTFYAQFRDHGYHTGFVGKLDLAKPDNYNGRHGDRPCNYTFGFTHPVEIEGKMHSGRFDTPRGPYGYYLQERGLYEDYRADYKTRTSEWSMHCHDSILPDEHWHDTYVGDRADQWLREVPSDYPWLLHVNFLGPHNPFDPPTEWADRWREADMPAPIHDSLEGKPNWHQSRVVHDGDQPASDAKILETRRQYAAMIEAIDFQIGRLLKTLEETGQLENTYIIYASDHGEMLGDHGMYTKSVAYEPSWHVPLCVAGPGIVEGQKSDALIELNDINPTVCEFAGVPVLPEIDARSFVAVTRGDAASHRDHVITTHHNFRAIRTATHKMVYNENDKSELYDMQADPQELNNLAEKDREMVGKLHGKMWDTLLDRKWLGR